MPAKTNHPSRAARRPSHASPTPVRPGRRLPAAWIAPWFNSPYYHTLYQHRDDPEAHGFIDHLARLLGLGHGSTILDLGCGRGRHAVYLAGTGADVTGLDLAPENIAYARRHAHGRLRFNVGDMRDPYGTACFSDILNLFTSFGYFAGDEDNVRVLRQASRALRPGGRLVIDFLNAVQVLRTLVPFETRQVGTTRFELARRLEAGFIVKEIQVTDGGTRRRFQERVQALALPDFLAYFRAVGLEVLHVFGSYTLSPFDPASSDRLILVARKPAPA